jgi:hypothetical protein
MSSNGISRSGTHRLARIYLTKKAVPRNKKLSYSSDFGYDLDDPIDSTIMKNHDPYFDSTTEDGIMSAANKLLYGASVEEITEWLAENYSYTPEQAFLAIKGAQILLEDWKSERSERVGD